MASDLTGQKIKDTYQQVLHVDGGVTSTDKTVYDGDGTSTGLKVSTTGVDVGALKIAGTAVTATAAELNYVDGVTSNIQTQLDSKPDNLTELGVTATASELNVLDGITASTAELNYTDGVTSSIQTQLNAKAPIASPTFTGTATIPTVDINGGSIDGTAIGASSASTGAFTSITGTSGIISANSSSDALRITQTGSGNALVVEDSANPDSTPFVVDASGKVVVGNESPIAAGTTTPLFQVQGNSGTATSVFNWASSSSDPSRIVLARSQSGAVNTRGVVANGAYLGAIRFMGDDGTAFIDAAQINAYVDGTPGTNDMPGRLVFSTTADGANSPTERMRIDSAGQIGVGFLPTSGRNFTVAKSITGSTISRAITAAGNIQQDVTVEATYFSTTAGTTAASFTLTSLSHYQSAQTTFGVGSSVTNQYGFNAGQSLTGATNNYGFYSNIASGTGRWNFYAAGSAANYFAGNVGIGTTSAGEKLDINGNISLASAADSFAEIRGGRDSSANGRTKITFNNIGSGSGGFITFETTAATALGITERVRIKPTGQTRFVPLSADPAGAEAGDVYYNSSTNKLKVYNGTSWVDLH